MIFNKIVSNCSTLHWHRDIERSTAFAFGLDQFIRAEVSVYTGLARQEAVHSTLRGGSTFGCYGSTFNMKRIDLEKAH